MPRETCNVEPEMEGRSKLPSHAPRKERHKNDKTALQCEPLKTPDDCVTTSLLQVVDLDQRYASAALACDYRRISRRRKSRYHS